MVREAWPPDWLGAVQVARLWMSYFAAGTFDECVTWNDGGGVQCEHLPTPAGIAPADTISGVVASLVPRESQVTPQPRTPHFFCGAIK